MRKPSFAPYENVTRGQVATISWRLAGEPLASATAFADVNYDEYYGKAVTWARATSVVSGYPNNTFAPDKPVSREELVSMMRNYAIKIAHMDPRLVLVQSRGDARLGLRVRLCSPGVCLGN